MSREIRFRGKHIQTGEWIYGGYCKDDFHVEDVKHYIVDQNNEAFGHVKIVQIAAETVGQYTGLKDRNGKEIYEGDVLRYLDAYTYGETGDWDEMECVGQIKWDDDLAQFYVTNRNSLDNDDFWEQIDEAEVIGNIYEHPHLLEAN